MSALLRATEHPKPPAMMPGTFIAKWRGLALGANTLAARYESRAGRGRA